MVRVEEIDETPQIGGERFSELLKKIRAKNFEDNDQTDPGEYEEVAETVCTSLQK